MKSGIVWACITLSVICLCLALGIKDKPSSELLKATAVILLLLSRKQLPVNQ